MRRKKRKEGGIEGQFRHLKRRTRPEVREQRLKDGTGDGTARSTKERESETRYSHESRTESEGHLSQNGPGIHPCSNWR